MFDVLLESVSCCLLRFKEKISFFLFGCFNVFVGIFVLIVFVGERFFMCEICGKSFVFKEYLKYYNRIYIGSKFFKCEVCLRIFV